LRAEGSQSQFAWRSFIRGRGGGGGARETFAAVPRVRKQFQNRSRKITAVNARVPQRFREREYARARAHETRRADPKKLLTHVCEVDDRDFALAEKGLASVRDHGRVGAITHPDNWSLLGNRLGFLLHRIVLSFRFQSCLSLSTSLPISRRSTALDFLSLSLSFRTPQREQQQKKKTVRRFTFGARSTRPPGIRRSPH